MDELIEYLANTPENTNFNIVREMLGNIGGSFSGEPNIKIVETLESSHMLIYIPHGNHDFDLFQVCLIQPIAEGIINNNSLAGTYIYDYDAFPTHLEITQLDQVPDSTIQSDEDYISARISGTMSQSHYQVYASNKTQNIYSFGSTMYLTEEELENNFTDLGEYEGIGET